MQATQAQVLGSLGQFSLPARLKTLGVPLTVIQGSLDAAAPPELAKAFVEALSSTAPKALVVFTASAHSPHFEEPQRFRAVLLEALST